MELEYLLAQLNNESLDSLIGKIKGAKQDIDERAVALFDLKNHDVLDVSKRPKIKVASTSYGSDGKPVLDAAGEKTTKTDYVEVNRIPIPVQKYIVNQRANMLLHDDCEIEAQPNTDIQKKLIEALRDTWSRLKMRYELKEVCVRQMSECEVAVLLSVEDAEEGYWEGTAMQGAKKKLRFNILKSEGNTALYPVFNRYDDMIAFARSYKTKDDDTGQDKEHWDIYTGPTNYYWTKQEAGWGEPKTEKNIDSKIPVIYFPQQEVEYADEQPMISRKETLKSNHGDSNDRVAFPILTVRAESVESLPAASDSSKVIQLVGSDSQAEYLEPANGIESFTKENENLSQDIDKYSGTIDFNSLHQFFGSAPSGYAIRLLFQNAHMKAGDKEGDFGKNVQRLLNLLKSLLCGLKAELRPAKNIHVKPVFKLFLPKNDSEEVDTLIKAKDAGLISHETAVMKCPLVVDTAAEWEKIKQELRAATTKPVVTNNTEEDKNELKVA